ncbi:MAG: LL-diaminopimelate aminotransferase [Candidatus Rokubacteria bacterium]|nr:LL-diaminopimelate aminotransferase [Candidatus Rokubacteria bacterium]
MSVELADRLKRLPPYLFAEIDRQKKEARARGADLIDLGIGDPDIPSPPHVIEALARAARDPKNHRYPDYEGLLAFRGAAAGWYQRQFGVTLDPAAEVLTLIGSKEGTAHIPLAFCNPGDVVLVPDPGYPVYQAGTLFAGAEPYFLPLRGDHDFLPDLDAVPAEVARRARMIFLNYPNNPTAACAPLEFFERLVRFAERWGLIVCHDAMYSEIRFDGERPPSFLQVPGAREVGVEFHSLSKTYSMTGWRIGFCVGNREVLAGLGKVKTSVDSGVFQAVQEAAIAALTGPQEYVAEVQRTYQERRDVVVQGLRRLGLPVLVPRATFFVWAPVPGGGSSTEWAERLLREAEVVVTPGVGFGPHGEGYYRIALTVDKARLAEAMERLARFAL